jgi:transposase
LDLALFLARYRGDGRGAAAFHPKAMLALLVYAYCDGERSSRRIEDRCRTDVAYRLLVAGQIPDHTTIARFRAQHEAAIGELFVQVLRVCLQAGMGRLGRVALDGTKAAAPASSRANKTIEAIDRELEKIAAQILAEAAAADLEEDTLFGPQQADPGRLPGRLRRLIRRRDRLIRAKQPVQDKNAAAQADYQRRMAERAAKEAATGKRTPGRKPAPPVADPTAKVNVTDPDSRLMKTVHRFVQGFNGQAMAAEDQLVLAADVVNDANDLAQLHPMIASAQNNLRRAGCDQPIGRLLADAGYPTERTWPSRTQECPTY